MKTTGLFRTIWRANAVIILAAGVMTLVVIAVSGFFVLKAAVREREVDMVVNTDPERSIEQSFALGSASQIAGHPWMLVPLESDQHYDQAYFSKSTSAARNYAFVSRFLETRWLYPHSRFLIVAATQLPRDDYIADSDVTSLVSFEVVQQDTDGDKRLTPEDSSALVLTRPDGTGATTILENISDVKVQELMGDEILIIYEDRDGYAAATFSLKDFSQVKRERFALPIGS